VLPEVARFVKGGSLLLIEDAVLCARFCSRSQDILRKLMDEGVEVYALSEDLEARGISQPKLSKGIKVVDMDGFVELVEKHEVVPWL
jgi:tRNA 2-thiouridine synthesizing protein B